MVLVVDHSLSMGEENRIGGLKRAVGSFLESCPGFEDRLDCFWVGSRPLCFIHDRPGPDQDGR